MPDRQTLAAALCSFITAIRYNGKARCPAIEAHRPAIVQPLVEPACRTSARGEFRERFVDRRKSASRRQSKAARAALDAPSRTGAPRRRRAPADSGNDVAADGRRGALVLGYPAG